MSVWPHISKCPKNSMSVVTFNVRSMIINCDSCSLRDLACKDCVVSFFLDRSDPTLDLSSQTSDAIDLLSSRGIVPPLRYIDQKLA